MHAPQIVEARSFARVVKKLHANQKADLFAAIREVAGNPEIGDLKVGDLAGVRVYKFSMNKQLTLLGYMWQENVLVLTLIHVGPHENFYRDLKK